jgi:hypothetical protein
MSVEPADDPTAVQPTAAPPPLFATQNGGIRKSRFFIGLGVGWVLVGIIALAVFSQQSASRHQAALSPATASTPAAVSRWTAAMAWKAPDGADDAIKGCKDWACLYGVLQRNGAPAETVEFLNAEHQAAPTDDLGYPVAFRGSGRVKAVEIFDPGLGMEGTSEFLFVNGPDGIVRPKIDINQATGSSPDFQRFKVTYPQVTPWDGLAFHQEVLLANGAQQFQFTQTLLNGCHACAVLGTLNIGFNFDGSGHYTGMSVLGVDSEKDAPYGALADDLAQTSQFFEALNLSEADGSTVSAQTQTIISAKGRCQFSVNTNPTLTTGWFMLDQTFNVKDVQVQRSSVPPSNELTILCNNSNACISQVYSDKRGAGAAISAVTLIVPQESLDAVALDVQRLQSICGGN